MANITLMNVLTQYVFTTRPNPVSKKMSFDVIIPATDPQAQQVINYCEEAWAKNVRERGQGNPQSKNYHIVMGNDEKRLSEKIRSMIDPNQQYVITKGVQTPDSKYPITTYDSGIVDENGKVVRDPLPHPKPEIVGDGSVINCSINIVDYSSQTGQRGVKGFGNWLQIVKLVESEYGNTGPGAISGGYTMSETEATLSNQMQHTHAEAQQMQQQQQQMMQQPQYQQPMMQQAAPQMQQQPMMQQAAPQYQQPMMQQAAPAPQMQAAPQLQQAAPAPQMQQAAPAPQMMQQAAPQIAPAPQMQQQVAPAPQMMQQAAPQMAPAPQMQQQVAPQIVYPGAQ